MLICFSAALSVSWILGFGLYYFFGTWIEEIYTYVLFNNFGFSVGLGAPLLIMLTSDDVNIACAQGPKRYLILKNEKMKKSIPVIHTLIMAVIMVFILVFHFSPADSITLGILTVAGVLGMVAISV